MDWFGGKNIKALILSAGKGTRLKPLTDKIPKPMIEVANKPVLEHIVDNLTHYDITQIVVNLNYKPEIIANYFGPKLYYFYEPYLLGESNTIALIHNLLGCHTLIVANGDTISNINLEKMLQFHYENQFKITRFMVSDRYAGTKIINCFSHSKETKDYTQEDGYYFDIGTTEKLAKAREFFK